MFELREHQKETVRRCLTERHHALFHQAGTGKTGTVISILREDFNRAKRIKRTLILAPPNVCPGWKEEFKNFSKIDQDSILVLTQSGKKRVEALEKFMLTGKPCIVVTNYESMQIKAFYETLLGWKPEIAIADESHRIKDAASFRAKKIYPLVAACERRFILTGTPVLNSLLDIYGQYKFLDPNIFGNSFWVFRNKYFYDRNAGKQFSFPDWVPQDFAAEHIGKTIAATSSKVALKDCVDLPPLQRIKVPVTMSPPQKRAYEQMAKDFVAECKGKVVSAEFAMTKTIRMQQILCGFIQPDHEQGQEKPPVVWFEDQPRIDAMMDILESIGKEKCIIWTTFQPTYNRIGKALEEKKFKYAYITGEQSTAEKTTSLKEFTEGDTQILVAAPAAASEGLNLFHAKYAIYFSRGYNLGHFLQSEARNFRSGSERHSSIIHYHLHTPNTLDTVIAAALFQKKSVGDAVLEWTNSIAHGSAKEKEI